jgi:hypothetical protein
VENAGPPPRRLAEWDAYVREADIVFRVDTQRRDTDGSGAIAYGPPGSAPEEHQTIFYGRSLLALIAGGYEGRSGLQTRVVQIPIDWKTADPEELMAMCRTLRGHCDLDDERPST